MEIEGGPMNVCRITWIALAGLISASADSFAVGPNPPFYIQRSPESVVVRLDQGQASFECTGTAIDIDVEDTVYFFTSFRPDFITFESNPGNPGSFRLFADNLNGSHYGGYFITVAAADSLVNSSNADSIEFTIQILPEPTALTSLVCGVPLLRRRRS